MQSCPMCKSNVDLEAVDINVDLPPPAAPAIGATSTAGAPRTGAVVMPVPTT